MDKVIFALTTLFVVLVMAGVLILFGDLVYVVTEEVFHGSH